MWNNNYLVKSAAERLASSERRHKTLYLTSSDQPELAELTSRLPELHEKHTGSGVTWQYKAMPDETHATIYHPAALLAFRRLFKPRPN